MSSISSDGSKTYVPICLSPGWPTDGHAQRKCSTASSSQLHPRQTALMPNADGVQVLAVIRYCFYNYLDSSDSVSLDEDLSIDFDCLSLVEPRKSVLCLFWTWSHITDLVVAEETPMTYSTPMKIQSDPALVSSSAVLLPSMLLCLEIHEINRSQLSATFDFFHSVTTFEVEEKEPIALIAACLYLSI